MNQERFTQSIIDCNGEPGRIWLKNLPVLIDHCAERWSLYVNPPFPNLSYNYAAPAAHESGEEFVLKLGVPSDAFSREITALETYAGRGIARLIDADPQRGIMLLEHLLPGAMLSTLDDDDQAMRIAARLMRELWQPVSIDHPFPTLSEWATDLQDLRKHFGGGTGPLPKDLVEKSEQLWAELIDSTDEEVLLHGDLHHFNILQAQRQPWLAIDPKGVVGDRAYDVCALMGNCLYTASNPQERFARRIEILSSELGIDRHRLMQWCLAVSMLWAWWSIEDHGPENDSWRGAVAFAELTDSVIKLP